MLDFSKVFFSNEHSKISRGLFSYNVGFFSSSMNSKYFIIRVVFFNSLFFTRKLLSKHYWKNIYFNIWKLMTVWEIGRGRLRKGLFPWILHFCKSNLDSQNEIPKTNIQKRVTKFSNSPQTKMSVLEIEKMLRKNNNKNQLLFICWHSISGFTEFENTVHIFICCGGDTSTGFCLGFGSCGILIFHLFKARWKKISWTSL
jgi:hypothetical protein